MQKSIKKLSQLALKLDAEYEEAGRLRKPRIFKRAVATDKKLKKALSKMFPLKDQGEITELAQHQLAWMQDRLTRRVGRITQNPLSRGIRRRYNELVYT